MGIRRAAGYWYKEERAGAAQMSLLAQEHREDMPLVNLLREEVRRWREAGYRTRPTSHAPCWSIGRAQTGIGGEVSDPGN